MAALVQQVHNNSSTSGTHSVATAAVAVGNLIVVQTYDTGTAANSVVTDDQGGTYTRVAFAQKATSADITGFYIRNALTASAAIHTVSSAPGATTGGGLQVTEYSGFTRTGASAARQSAKEDNQVAGGTPAPDFAVAADTNNPVLGAVFNASNPAGLTPPTNWTERRDAGYNTPTTGFEAVTRNSGFTGTTVTWGSTSATAFCSLIVELDTSVLADEQVPYTNPMPALIAQ